MYARKGDHQLDLAVVDRVVIGRGARVSATLAACFVAGYVAIILPMALPQIAPSIAPLANVGRLIVPQNWQLFAPDIPTIDAALIVQCSVDSETFDIEADLIRTARRYRWHPANKAMHGPRAIAHEIFFMHERGELSESLRERSMRYARSICFDHGYKSQPVRVSVRVTNTVSGHLRWINVHGEAP